MRLRRPSKALQRPTAGLQLSRDVHPLATVVQLTVLGGAAVAAERHGRWADQRTMVSEFHEQWRALESAARAALTRSAVRDDLQAKCHCVFLPSFEDCRAYTVLLPSPRSPLPPLGVRRVWRRKMDLAKFESPVMRLRYGPKLEPTVEENEAGLEREVIEMLLGAASSMSVPAHPEQPQWGADGEAYVLDFPGSFLSSQFRWWGEPPSGWETLRDLHIKVAGVVEGGLTRR